MNLVSTEAFKKVVKAYNTRFLIILLCNIVLGLSAAGIAAFLLNVLLRRFEINLNFLDAWSTAFVVITLITTVKHYRKISYLVFLYNFLQWKYKASASDVLEAVCVHNVNLEKGFLTWNNAKFSPWLAGVRVDLQRKIEEQAQEEMLEALVSMLSSVFGDSDLPRSRDGSSEGPFGRSPGMTAFRGYGPGFRPRDLGVRDYDDDDFPG